MKNIIVLLSFIMLCSPGMIIAGEPVKFGSVTPLSGRFKDVGARYLEGARYAVLRINQQGGLLGRKIRLIPIDSQLKPEPATNNIRKAILKDNISFFGQGGSSKVTSVLSHLVKTHNRLGFAWGSESASLTGENCNRNFFRTCLNTDMHSNALAAWVAESGRKKVFGIAPDYSFGREAMTGFKKRLKKLNPSVKMVGEAYHKLGEIDLTPYIAQMIASKAEIIFTPSWGNDLRLLIKQAHKLNLKARFACYYLNDNITIAALSNDAVIGNVTSECYMLSIPTQANKTYIDGFYKKHGYYPSSRHTKSYMGVMFWAEAVKKAGKYDVDAVIRSWEGLTYDGPAGKQCMRPYDHQNQIPAWIAEIVRKNTFYTHPYVGKAVVIPAKDISVPAEESGCPGLAVQQNCGNDK